MSIIDKSKMTNKRWVALFTSNTLDITQEEIDTGWHFCPDWDGLLIGPGMPGEQELCLCFR